MKNRIGTAAVGVAFGFVLSRIGFSSWDQVHAMFTFADLRMLLSFCLAVVLLAISWRVMRLFGSECTATRSLHPGTLTGGVLFGIGWALSGACPSIGVVQLGEGQLAAGWTLLGMVAGNYLYSVVHARYLRWDTGSCADD